MNIVDKKYKISILVFLLLFAVSTFQIKVQGQSKYPDTKKGVKQMALDLKKASIEDIKKLMPTMDDCKAIMKAEMDARKLYNYVEKMSSALVKMTESPIKARKGQTAVLVKKVTIGGANMLNEQYEFPGGYKKIFKKMKKGITLYEFKYVEPEMDYGRRYDGLMFINNKWVFVPKMWRAFRK